MRPDASGSSSREAFCYYCWGILDSAATLSKLVAAKTRMGRRSGNSHRFDKPGRLSLTIKHDPPSRLICICFIGFFSAALQRGDATVSNIFSMLKTLSKPKPTTFKA
jgi:hypothetical protein